MAYMVGLKVNIDEQEKLDLYFKMFDTDNDGFLSKAEIKAALEPLDSEHRFESLLAPDADYDELIS